MSGWQTFFAMGGYAAFVWPAYAISLIALLGLGVVSWREMKRSERLAALSENAKTPER
jgi:heme exporter protein D